MKNTLYMLAIAALVTSVSAFCDEYDLEDGSGDAVMMNEACQDGLCDDEIIMDDTMNDE